MRHAIVVKEMGGTHPAGRNHRWPRSSTDSLFAASTTHGRSTFTLTHARLCASPSPMCRVGAANSDSIMTCDICNEPIESVFIATAEGAVCWACFIEALAFGKQVGQVVQ